MPLTRRALLLGALAGLSACGFVPVYGSGAGLERLRDATVLSLPETENAFALRARIEERLGQPLSPTYELSITPDFSQNAVARSAAGDITRYTVTGKADYVLRDMATGDQIVAGQVSGFTGYSATLTTVATFSARRDAYERLAIQLADLMLGDLMAALP